MIQKPGIPADIRRRNGFLQKLGGIDLAGIRIRLLGGAKREIFRVRQIEAVHFIRAQPPGRDGRATSRRKVMTRRETVSDEVVVARDLGGDPARRIESISISPAADVFCDSADQRAEF